MNRVYLWFYCLSFQEASLVLFCAAVGFLYLQKKLCGRALWRAAVGFGLAIWLGVVIWATITSREADGSAPKLMLELFHDYRNALRYWNWEYLREDHMNAALFFPGGLLVSVFMPERWSLGRRFAAVAAGCCIVSVGIEIVQYLLGVGLAETDDVIHNTLGGILGFWASRMPVRVGPMTHSGTGRGS